MVRTSLRKNLFVVPGRTIFLTCFRHSPFPYSLARLATRFSSGSLSRTVQDNEPVMFTGKVAGPGFGHFSKFRPKFYQRVLELTGMALYHGTINVRIDGD